MLMNPQRRMTPADPEDEGMLPIPSEEPSIDPDLPTMGLLSAAGMEDEDNPATPARVVANMVASILYSEEAMPSVLDALSSDPDIAKTAPLVVNGMLTHIMEEAPEITERELFGPGKALDRIMGDVFDLAESAGYEPKEGDYQRAMRNTIKLIHERATGARSPVGGGGDVYMNAPRGDGGMVPGGGGGLLSDGPAIEDDYVPQMGGM